MLGAVLALLLLAAKVQAEYSEELVVQPFGYGQLLTVFAFEQAFPLPSSPSRINSYGYFPRPIVELVNEYELAELQLTMTVGRWMFDEWGMPPHGMQAAPTGIYMHARMADDGAWKQLVASLAGLFCASLNLADELLTGEPRLILPPSDPLNIASVNPDGYRLRMTEMPREAVCTENLTPFLKLLPCTNKAGVASLINPLKVFNSRFHSMSVLVQVLCSDAACAEKRVLLRQTLSMVFNWSLWNPEHLNWTLKDIFERSLGPQIDFAKQSAIHLVLPASLKHLASAVHSESTSVSGDFVRHTYLGSDMSAQIGMRWSDAKRAWDIQDAFAKAQIGVFRSIIGNTFVSGELATRIVNRTGAEVRVAYHELLPWYMPITLHDLRLHLNGQLLAKHSAVIERLFYTPAIDRKRPAEVEFLLRIPASAELQVVFNFEKCLLRVNEYPFDPNRGFDIAYHCAPLILDDDRPALFFVVDGGSDKPGHGAPLMHTWTLVLSLPVPDFTMPYNVIMLTSTAVAFFCGFMFNYMYQRVYLWRPGELPVGAKRRLRYRIANAVRAVVGRARRVLSWIAPRKPTAVEARPKQD